MIAGCAAPAVLAAAPRTYPALHPPTLLAQRSIEREWGPSDDSLYRVVDIPGLKSEALATSLSAMLPGAGQLYAEERSGWLFLAAEAAGWGGLLWYRHDGHRLQDVSARVAGPPDQAGSAWSFDRWAEASGGNAGSLAALYAADPQAFYRAIGSDPSLASGWANESSHADFNGLRTRANARFGRARTYATGLWFNHLVGALDALRAARFHNLPLRQNVGMRIAPRGTAVGPAVAMTLEVRF